MIVPLAAIPFPDIDPVFLRIGPLELRWYGLAYLLGFLLAYLLLRRLIARRFLRLNHDQLNDLTTWLVLGVLLGGRAGWWIFYHRPVEEEPWWEPIAIWRGGMSFHGGLLGVAVALVLWTWRHNAPFWNIADALALVTPIGLFFGRIANFINAELVGRPSDLPWAVLFPGYELPRHPSQLYEAILEGPILLAAVWGLRRGPLAEGRIAAGFLILYGLFRFLVEFTREPDPQLGFLAFGWLTMGQLLSLLLIAAGIGLWVFRGQNSTR